MSSNNSSASKLSRRLVLKGLLAGSVLATAGCAAKFGSKQSYLTPVLEPRNHNAIFHWIDIALQQVRDQRVPPPRAAYNLAMPLAAGFLAANGITQQFGERFGIGQGPVGANPEVAYGVAFGIAAAQVFQQPFVVERHSFLQRYPKSEATTLGVEWGKRVGNQIVQMRVDDGSEPSEVNYYLGRYPLRSDALRWSPTGPHYSAKPGPAFGSYDRALFPGQGKIKPWTMQRGSQFRAQDFYDPRSPEFAAEYAMVRDLGSSESKIRSKDESEIALFWEDGPWGLTPSGHFLLIAVQILQDRNLSFMELARTFALMGMTQCDASISAWDSKYHHDIVRPETAIRSRAEDFNNPDPRVSPVPGWKSYIPTPEFPAYTSGHSTFGAAACQILRMAYGSDKVTFSHESPDQVIWPQLRGRKRTWHSLSDVAEENGLSRIYGGVHWLIDHKEGMAAGLALAEQAYLTTFPVKG